MDANELRALADAIVYRDSLAIARAADYLRAQADAQPVAWRVRTLGQQPGPWRAYWSALRPCVLHPSQCEFESLYARPAPAVPAGYKLVPVEPTEAMREAADRDTTYYGHVATNNYKAMLAAAPAAPQAEPPQVFTRWVRDNMPPNTVISNPDWWAARLWRAAMRAHGIGGSDE